MKNIMFAGGMDDPSQARCRLEDGVATITCAAAEVGQGFVTLAQQIAREILGVDEVILAPASTIGIASAGSTSASRQTWMSGGAVQAACVAVRDCLLEHVAERLGVARESLEIIDDKIVSLNGELDMEVRDAAPDEVFEKTASYSHAPTQELNENGQGNHSVSFAFSAHRAVVDVDIDLGLVRVVEITTSQDVGRVLNPTQLVGQIEGGTAQGVGLAVMEEVIVDHGRVRNPSFTDYVIPTTLDMPPVHIAAFIEEPEPGSPMGAKGAGEPPLISSAPAIVAAIRAATGLELPRIPVRPQDIALAGMDEPQDNQSLSDNKEVLQ
jgi:CO/xanthine dehydrogenase Mo-binding subunit